MGARFNEKYEPWMNDAALEKFKQGKSVTSVCCTLEISRETYYQWRDDKDHPFYPVAKRGEQYSQQYWEDKGQEGTLGEIEKFAGSSWQFIMKNRFRDSYSDQAPKDARDTLIEKLLDKV